MESQPISRLHKISNLSVCGHLFDSFLLTLSKASMHWFFLNTVGISSLGCIAFVGVRVGTFSSSASVAGIMFATKKLFTGRGRMALAMTAASLGGAGSVVHCNEDHIPSLDYGWSHHGALASFDMASVRRGFQVYRQVCASCHSIKEISFRNLVGNTHDEAGTSMWDC